MNIKKWDYLTCMIPAPHQDNDSYDRRMQELGDQGWELAGVGGQNLEGYRMFFKRPRKEPTVRDILPPQ